MLKGDISANENLVPNQFIAYKPLFKKSLHLRRLFLQMAIYYTIH